MNSLFPNVTLASGPHYEAGAEMCAMEMVAWLNGEEHTDTPKCSGEFIAGFVQHLNDSLSHADRQRLIPYIPRLIGTAGDEKAHRDVAETFVKTIEDRLDEDDDYGLTTARQGFVEGFYVLSGSDYAFVLIHTLGFDALFTILDAMIEAGPTGEFEPKRNPATAAVELGMVPA